MQGGSGFLAADGQTLSVADDDRPAVCERFYRIAVRTVDRYGTGGVDEMPAASRADGGQAFGEVETGVVYGWDQFPFSDFETPQSVPDEELPRSAGVSGPQTAYRTSGFKFGRRISGDSSNRAMR